MATFNGAADTLAAAAASWQALHRHNKVRHRGCSVADAHRDQRWRRRPGERGLFRAR
jgi:hypothetical protein